MEVFGGGGGPGVGMGADPFGGGWGDPTGQDFGGQVVGGGFTGTGEVSEGLAEVMAAAAASNRTDAVPTVTVRSNEPMSVVTQTIQDLTRFSAAKTLASFLAQLTDLTPTRSYMYDDPRATGGKYGNFNLPTPAFTTQGVKGYLEGKNYGENNIVDVAMAGMGPGLAPATAISTIGGRTVHEGPGFPMSEDFFPGYGTNPYSNDPMAEGGGDTYIRKPRGTEIAALIGA